MLQLTPETHQENKMKNGVMQMLDFNPARNVVEEMVSAKGLLSEE